MTRIRAALDHVAVVRVPGAGVAGVRARDGDRVRVPLATWPGDGAEACLPGLRQAGPLVVRCRSCDAARSLVEELERQAAEDLAGSLGHVFARPCAPFPGNLTVPKGTGACRMVDHGRAGTERYVDPRLTSYRE